MVTKPVEIRRIARLAGLYLEEVKENGPEKEADLKEISALLLEIMEITRTMENKNDG